MVHEQKFKDLLRDTLVSFVSDTMGMKKVIYCMEAGYAKRWVTQIKYILMSFFKFI